MIRRLCDMIGSADAQTLTPVGYRLAVPMPFMGGLFDRLRDAWAVLRGFDNRGSGVAAVRWPQAGELDAALRLAGVTTSQGAALSGSATTGKEDDNDER